MKTKHVAGLTLQAHRMLEKGKRGIATMAGRRSKESARESMLISDAGVTLAMHAGNASLAREFGLAAASCRISLDVLRQNGLPNPCLALNFPEVARENFLMLDQRYPKAPEAPRCVLAVLSLFWSLVDFAVEPCLLHHHQEYHIVEEMPANDIL